LLLYCLSFFYLRFLITPLVSSNFLLLVVIRKETFCNILLLFVLYN
jgi:hypothetical protein